MNHRIYLVAVIAVLIGIQPVFARPAAETVPIQQKSTEAAPPVYAEDTGGTAGTEPAVVPYRIRNNSYFQESQRHFRLAEGSYNIGDYDASTNYAQEAIRYATLSDEYVALQMKIRETNNAIAAAKTRIDWAVSTGASKQYPGEFQEAERWYGKSLNDRKAEEWDNAIDSAHRVVELLAYIGAPPAVVDAGQSPLPASYAVRLWSSFGDCFWNIAGNSWAYGDPFKWKVLYDANKSKLPDPNNPNLILPDMILDIPSLKGETRQGAWDEHKKYEPFN